jgi:small-conductance mechanosensitive channel
MHGRACRQGQSKMKRNTAIMVLVLLMLACGIPAYGANKEMIQLEEQVKLLGTQMTRMQQSFDEKLAALQANAEQTSDNVKQISAWAQHVDATLKQQTADSDTCADQLSGNSKVLREQLEELRSRLDRIAKQLHDMSTPPATNSTTSPPAAGANPSMGGATQSSDTAAR